MIKVAPASGDRDFVVDCENDTGVDLFRHFILTIVENLSENDFVFIICSFVGQNTYFFFGGILNFAVNFNFERRDGKFTFFFWLVLSDEIIR